VHFMDKDTERFVRSRMESVEKLPAVEQNQPAYTGKTILFQPRIVKPKPNERYVTCVPLVPLKAAAGVFGDPQQRITEDGFDWRALHREALRKKREKLSWRFLESRHGYTQAN